MAARWRSVLPGTELEYATFVVALSSGWTWRDSSNWNGLDGVEVEVEVIFCPVLWM